jgi:hypothetical protein
MDKPVNAEGDHDDANGRDPNDIDSRNMNLRAAPQIGSPSAEEHPERNEQGERIPKRTSSVWRG